MKERIEVLILFLLFFIGALGLSIPFFNPFFAFMTPFFLFATGIYSFMRAVELNAKSFSTALSVLAATFFIEVAGVKTGIIFGEYSYGAGLGFRIFEVPPVIGLNWVILMLGGLSIASVFTESRVLSSLISAILLVFLDVLIEPSAIRHGWWDWSNAAVPFQNYAAWFIIAFLFSLILFSVRRRRNERLFASIYLMQLSFFVIMHSI